jgi:hypothetical protein
MLQPFDPQPVAQFSHHFKRLCPLGNSNWMRGSLSVFLANAATKSSPDSDPDPNPNPVLARATA